MAANDEVVVIIMRSSVVRSWLLRMRSWWLSDDVIVAKDEVVVGNDEVVVIIMRSSVMRSWLLTMRSWWVTMRS